VERARVPDESGGLSHRRIQSAGSSQRPREWWLARGTIRIKHNNVAVGVTQTNWQGQFERSSPCIVSNPSLQAGTQHKKLCFTHGAFQTEQQTIIEGGRIVEALFIQDQRVRQRTNFQEVMPIAGVACEPRHFQT
jgi:hypothetical protein